MLDRNCHFVLPPEPFMSMQFPLSGAAQSDPNKLPPTISTLVPFIVLNAPADVAVSDGVSPSKFSLSRVVAAMGNEINRNVLATTNTRCIGSLQFEETRRLRLRPVSFHSRI